MFDLLPLMQWNYSRIEVHHVNKAKQGKANGSTQGRQLISKEKLNCPERDSNPRSLAYMTSALTTKPPRQLSGRGTNPGNIEAMQCN